MMRLLVLGACTMLLSAQMAIAETSERRPAPSAIADAAEHEGNVVVYGSTSERFARYLVDEFKALHPAISVKYVSLPVDELDRRARRDAATSNGPDVVWSSAMDLQMKAGLDGLAEPYRSPEAVSLPAWAKWRDRLYATTYEPVVLVYNRRLIAPDQVPTTHDKLRELLTADVARFRGKVTTYDLDNVELGDLPFRVDAASDPRFWNLLHTLRAEGLNEQASSAGILDRISQGRSLIAYDIAGAEAIRRARRDPLVGVQFTLDYTLIMSRVVFISRSAPHPNAARLWVDFLLSKRGQQQMQLADLYPIRQDISGIEPGVALLRQTSNVAKPIALDSKLAALCAPHMARTFRERWRTSPGRLSPGSRPAHTDALATSTQHAPSAHAAGLQ